MINSKVIILGAGPSGITAAIYFKRAGIPFILIEKSMPGGKVALTAKVDNYPGLISIDGVDLALKFQEQLNEFDIEITYDSINKLDKVDSSFILEGDFDSYSSEYVIIATGTKERKMELPNEDKFYGRGVSFCAICDGALYKNKDVAVIGGGNSALEEALYLASIVNKVHLIHRRNEFRGDLILEEKIKENKNIIIHTPYVPSSLLGDKNIEGLMIKNVETSIEEQINLSAVFVYIGNIPNTDYLSLEVEKESGYIKVDEDMLTSVDKLYAIGDVRNKKLRQIVTAVNDGALAAIAIEKEINKA